MSSLVAKRTAGLLSLARMRRRWRTLMRLLEAPELGRQLGQTEDAWRRSSLEVIGAKLRRFLFPTTDPNALLPQDAEKRILVELQFHQGAWRRTNCSNQTPGLLLPEGVWVRRRLYEERGQPSRRLPNRSVNDRNTLLRRTQTLGSSTNADRGPPPAAETKSRPLVVHPEADPSQMAIEHDAVDRPAVLFLDHVELREKPRRVRGVSLWTR